MSSWTTERARVASLTRSRDPQDPDLLEARRNLLAARGEDYITNLINAAPRLTEQQRQKLAMLLLRGAA